MTIAVFTTFLPDSRHAHELVDRLAHARLALRHVGDAVGVEREQRVDVVGGDDAGGLVMTAEVGCVLADLVVGVGVHADELEVGPPDDGAQRRHAGVAGAPLDDAQRAIGGGAVSSGCSRLEGVVGKGEGQVEGRDEAAVGVAHVGDRVDEAHRGGDHARRASSVSGLPS